MHLYVELWNPKPAWEAMSAEERGAYMEQADDAIGELTGKGVEIVGFAVADGGVPHSAGYRYLAVWTMPDPSLAEALEAAVEEAGWHEYFDQVNARGELVDPGTAIGHMISGG